MNNLRSTPPRQWPAWVFGMLICAALVLGAWAIYERFHGDWMTRSEQESGGHFGPTSGSDSSGTAFAEAPYWYKGDHFALCVYCEYKGRPRGPAVLILLRENEKNRSNWASTVGSGLGSKVNIDVMFDDKAKQPFWVRFHVSREPVTEKLSLGAKDYPLDEGRLFLVDLRSEPANVSQLKHDLAHLLPVEDAGQKELKQAVSVLQEKSETVRHFWQNP